MQAEELRIGNKIQDGNGFIFDVVSVFEDNTVYCDFKENEGAVWEFDKNNPCYGIPLTKEILLKCENTNVSFSSDPQECGASKLYKIGELHIHQLNEDESYFIVFINHEIKHVKYVHQLQNLIYVLTNQELNIKL